MSSEEDEVFKEFVEFWTPTQNDLNQELSNEDLTLLCLRKPCRVAMWQFNPVYDYQKFFKERGTLENKDPRKILRLLAKAVNRYKVSLVPDEATIQQARQVAWEQTKKDNLILLDFIKYQRNKENEEIMPTKNGSSSNNVSTLSNTGEEVVEDVFKPEYATISPKKNKLNGDADTSLIAFSDDVVTVEVESEGSNCNVAFLSNSAEKVNEKQFEPESDTNSLKLKNKQGGFTKGANNSRDNLLVSYSDDVANVQFDQFNILNTESICIDSQNTLQIQLLSEGPIIPSQPVLYDDFSSNVPQSSTQNLIRR